MTLSSTDLITLLAVKVRILEIGFIFFSLPQPMQILAYTIVHITFVVFSSLRFLYSLGPWSFPLTPSHNSQTCFIPPSSSPVVLNSFLTSLPKVLVPVHYSKTYSQTFLYIYKVLNEGLVLSLSELSRYNNYSKARTVN